MKRRNWGIVPGFDSLLMKVTIVRQYSWFFTSFKVEHSIGSSDPVGFISMSSTGAFAWSKVTCDNVVVEARDRGPVGRGRRGSVTLDINHVCYFITSRLVACLGALPETVWEIWRMLSSLNYSDLPATMQQRKTVIIVIGNLRAKGYSWAPTGRRQVLLGHAFALWS